MRVNVSIAQMERLDKAIYSYVTELENLAKRLGKLHSVIDAKSYGNNTKAVKDKIEDYKRLVRKEKAIVNTMAVNLEKITVAYQNTEHDAITLITDKQFKKVTIKNNKVNGDAAKKSSKDNFSDSKLNQDLYNTKKNPAKPGNQQKPSGGSGSASNGGASAAKNDYPKSQKGMRNYMADVMVKKWGLTKAQAAGILGNIQCESGFSPTNAQDSYGYKGADNSNYISKYNIHDGVGWGICQWTYHSRKQGLLDLAKKRGTNVGDLDTQLAYLKQELNGYGLLSKIKKTKSVDEVTKIFMTQFEKPANQSASAIAGRQKTARNILNEIK